MRSLDVVDMIISARTREHFFDKTLPLPCTVQIIFQFKLYEIFTENREMKRVVQGEMRRERTDGER